MDANNCFGSLPGCACQQVFRQQFGQGNCKQPTVKAKPVYEVSFEMLQDIFDGGEETAGMGRSDGIQFYLAQIAKEHQFYKEHGNHAEG